MESEPRQFSRSSRIRSFGHAFRGIYIVLKTQPNAKIHLVATVLVCALGAWLHISRDEWCWLCVAITSVWVAESLNTAVEFVVDLVSPEYHPLAGKAKDVAAGAVLICAIGAAVIGILIFGMRLLAVFHH